MVIFPESTIRACAWYAPREAADRFALLRRMYEKQERHRKIDWPIVLHTHVQMEHLAQQPDQ